MDVVKTQHKMTTTTRQRRNGRNNSVEFLPEGNQKETRGGGGDSIANGTATAANVTSNNTSQHQESTNKPIQPKRRSGPFERFRRRGRAKRSTSAPPTLGRPYNPLLQDHFRVDAARRVVLPGVPVHDDDWARDSHDFFNLIFLIPVVALNVMNWNWDVLLKDVIFGSSSQHHQQSSHHNNKHHHQQQPQRLSIPDAWTGDWFDLFFQVTLLYLIVDLIWILVIPSCVKSPATIIQHHLATMLYIFLPYFHSEYQWCMGACMIVEVNTWFLIARRVFNKQGFPPWILNLSFISIRVKLISILFYVTWIAIRCILYPSLMPLFYQAWQSHSIKVNTPWNVVILCIPLHGFFCYLNIKWSYDLLMSKIRYWRRPKNAKAKDYVSKGL